MPKSNDETSGKRVRLSDEHGNNYLFIAEQDILVTVADENDPKRAKERAYIESNCRIASKAMHAGVPMIEVAEQMKKADAGRGSLLGQMAEIMVGYAEGRV
jgi:hypothetical protein